tara:strand:- start:12177 stop:14738 length:2562 start_codon:yes stop_codon:yes gene_type:complete
MPSGSSVLKIAASLDILLTKAGAMGLNVAAMRNYLVDFNNALRISDPILSQFGISMEEVRSEASKMSKEFNIAPEQIFGLYEAINEGFTIPPFDQVSDGLRVAREMFGYSDEAVSKFFAKMNKLTSMGPRFEDFVANFIKLQSANLQDTTKYTAELAKQAAIGEQALRYAYATGEIDAKTYRSRVAMFRLSQQTTDSEKKQKDIADIQMETKTRFANIQKMMVMDSGIAGTLAEKEANILEIALKATKEKKMTEAERAEHAKVLNAELDKMAAKNQESAAAANVLRNKYAEILGPQTDIAHLQQDIADGIAKAHQEFVNNLTPAQKATLKELEKEEKIRIGIENIFTATGKQLKIVQNTQKAISAELASQLGLQESLAGLISRVGDVSGTVFEDMKMSSAEILDTAVMGIELKEKEVAYYDNLIEQSGKLIESGMSENEVRNVMIEQSKEAIALLGDSEEAQKEKANHLQHIKDLEEGVVDVGETGRANLEAMANTSKEELVNMHQKFDLSKKNANLFEYQRDVLAIMGQQAQLQVDLADSLAKGVGASVEARLKAADVIGQQIVMLEKEKALNIEDEAQLKRTITIKGKTSAAGIAATGALQNLRKRNMEIEKDTLDLQMQQVNALKQLRDGFIDAISAMTTGAGVFSEIIVDQDHNLGAFMRTTEEAVSVLRTGAAMGRGAGASRHGIGGFVRGRGPEGDYDILPESVDELISQASASRELMETSAGTLGVIGAQGQRQLEALHAGNQTSNEIVAEIKNINGTGGGTGGSGGGGSGGSGGGAAGGGSSGGFGGSGGGAAGGDTLWGTGGSGSSGVSSSDAKVIGTNIADLLKKALLEAHKQLVEDGFVSAG